MDARARDVLFFDVALEVCEIVARSSQIELTKQTRSSQIEEAKQIEQHQHDQDA